MVFDKGVESIHSSYYEYLSQLINKLEALLSKNNISCEIEQIFNEKYKFLCDRLKREVDLALNSLEKTSLAYNEIKFSKIVYHLMFLKRLVAFTDRNSEGSLIYSQISEKLKAHSSNLNCFMQIYL